MVIGSKATNYQLCSNHSEIVTEQCSNYVLPTECTADTSSATPSESNNSDNTGVYIGVGVGLVFTILVPLVYCCWKKKKKKTLLIATNTQVPTFPLILNTMYTTQIQLNTNRDGYLSPLEISTLPNDNRQPITEQPPPSNHPAQSNNEPSTSNQSTRHTVFTRFVARALIFFNLTHCRTPIQTGVYLSTGACYFQSKITTKIIVEDKYFTTFNLSPYDLIIT